MNLLATHPSRFRARHLVARVWAALLCLLPATDLLAQVTVEKQRAVAVNGRPVQEIRLAREPGSRTLMRAVVVTNGPTAGTTSLLTALADANAWPDSAAAAPVFTPVVASGTVFSVGGGCNRGNQLDFPYIDGNRPRILRIVNGTPTVITPAIAGNELFDSADCTPSGDGTRTYFIFSNRSVQRLWFFIDAGGATDLNNPVVTFSAVRSPFQGGLRPAISIVPGTPRTVALLYMATNGQSRWLQYNAENLNVDFDCLAGTQSPAPTGFTIPRGAKVANRDVVADFNNDGTFEMARIVPTPPAACAAAPTGIDGAGHSPHFVVALGPVAGPLFNWSEPAIFFSPFAQRLNFLATSLGTIAPNGATSVIPGPPSSGGSYAGCAADGPDAPFRVVIAYVLNQAEGVRFSKAQIAELQQAIEGVSKSSFEGDDIGELFCTAFFVGFN
jgi:hypothetical protein